LKGLRIPVAMTKNSFLAMLQSSNGFDNGGNFVQDIVLEKSIGRDMV